METVSLALLPGLDGTGLLFQPFVAALPADIHPIIVRYPGDRHLTYEQLLPIVIEALPRSVPFVILGESYSGPLAVMIAAKAPNNLIGLILCASFIRAPRPILRPLIPFLSRLPLVNLYFPFKLFRAVVGRYSTPEFRSQLDDMKNHVRPSVIAARLRDVFSVDVAVELQACKAPKLYLQAVKDRVVTRRNLRIVQQYALDMQTASVKGPHMILQRAATESAEVIASFVRSCAEKM